MNNTISQDQQVASTSDNALHIGQELERARMDAGLSLQQVSEQLHISASYLGAIETLDKEALPSLGYVLGFMRSYAKFLNLDTVEAVERYKNESEIPRDLGMRNSPHFVERRQIRLPKGSIAASLMISCFSVLAIWYASSSDAESTTPLTSIAPLQSDLGFALPQPTQGDPNIVTLKATGPSWVEIKEDSGEIIVERIFVSGEIFETRKDSGLILSARDGGALELYRAGELFGHIGTKGQAVKNLSLQ